MRLIVVLSFALVVTLFGPTSAQRKDDPEESFLTTCKKELRQKGDYNLELLDKDKKQKIWEDFLALRGKRIELGKTVGQTNCSGWDINKRQLWVQSDEELFDQLCLEEKLWRVNLQQANEEFVQKEMKRHLDKAVNRRVQLVGPKECPPIGVDETDLEKLPTKSFFENCQLEVFYGHIYAVAKDARSRLWPQINFKPIDELAIDTSRLYDQYKFARKAKCLGEAVECCGPELVEVVRVNATSTVAQLILDNTTEELPKFEERYVSVRGEDNLDEIYKQFCQLEYRIGVENGYFQLKDLILLNQIKNGRTSLGALLNKRHCEKEVESLELPAEKDAKRMSIDGDCEYSFKPKAMCEALRALDTNEFEYAFHRYDKIKDAWCKKKSLHEDRADKSRRPLKPRCTDEMKAAVLEQTKAEVENILAYLRLQSAADKAEVRRKALKEHLDEVCVVLNHVAKSFKGMLSHQSGALKEASGKAYELVNQRRNDLEAKTKQYARFSLLKPSTW